MLTRMVAEIATNHNGSIEMAKMMAESLIESGFWGIKGQYRSPNNSWKDKPYGHVGYSYGDTYWDHRMALDLTPAEHVELSDFCIDLGGVYFVSVWDTTGVPLAADIGKGLIKIPSAVNSNVEILKAVKETGAEVILSTGMLDTNGFNAALGIMGPKVKYALATTCAYPADLKDLNLARIRSLSWVAGHQPRVGLSGHHKGCLPDLVAVGMGAKMIERHVTFDKAAKGPDHKMSISLAEARALVNLIKEAECAIGDSKLGLLGCERTFAEKVGRA